jgi:prepilin-type N-terminal cleavage/methylation domain-containing protein/prepilin-type processing-associated H-X9-DG protein
MRVRIARRYGYTLLEVLLAITLIVIIVGLLFPAFHKIREASFRMACTNNLKMMGAGFHQYHEHFGYLPDGGKNQCQLPYHPLMPIATQRRCDETHTNPADLYGTDGPFAGPWSTATTLAERRQEWSWPYQILPFVDERALHQNADDNVLSRTPLALYHCPTRRSATLYNEHATIDYAGSAGTNGLNGIIVPHGSTPVTFKMIPDGLASTIMVAEKRLKRDRFGVSVDDRRGWAAPGWSFEIQRQAAHDLDRPADDVGPSPDIHQTNPTIFPDLDSPLRQFGSAHQAGVNALFADGSVRYIRFNPNPGAFQRFCTRNDGLAVSQNEL